VPDADQQHAELAALLLALSLATTHGIASCTLVGDSSSALHACAKLSCPSALPHRAAFLRQLALRILSSGIRFSLFYIPSAYNPADPISRTPFPFATTPSPWVLPSDHPAVIRANTLATDARPRPLRHLGRPRPLRP
jgi:hypothetical protein